MSRTDLIADVLSSIRNASFSKKEKVDVPASNLGKNILEVFKKEGFVSNYKFIDDKKQGLLRVYLKYSPDKAKVPVITGVKKISKPGLRVYTKADKIKRVYGGLGCAIISTSKGILTDKDARQAKIGGEVICQIW